jgi:hypothetical protein
VYLICNLTYEVIDNEKSEQLFMSCGILLSCSDAIAFPLETEMDRARGRFLQDFQFCVYYSTDDPYSHRMLSFPASKSQALALEESSFRWSILRNIDPPA